VKETFVPSRKLAKDWKLPRRAAFASCVAALGASTLVWTVLVVRVLRKPLNCP
jgi:hypothetical protein